VLNEYNTVYMPRSGPL